MIKRVLEEKIRHLAKKFPIISVTGPRQSGKTTLIKSIFPEYRYESLEDPDTRLFATTDPRGFLESDTKMVIDEIQRAPELFSYLQTYSDRANISGQYIISGSQSFLLNQHISQSLAGRVAVLNLMPLSFSELTDHGIPVKAYEKLIYQGFYPRLYDKKISPGDFYPNYIQTYIERDVRQLQNIHDLTLFVRFLKLCAGRTGQLLNLNSLANDCGISPNTAKSWISVLAASYIIFLLQPHYKNFNKRLVKMPKLYFIDTGLASSLLEIRSESQLSTHFLRGALFENLIISEFIKLRLNNGLRSNCYFWRDNKGIEIDCIIENGNHLTPVEIKSGNTFNQEFFRHLDYWNKLSDNPAKNSYLIFGGDSSRNTKDGILLSWRDLYKIPVI
ncbi:MAG TPA: ATP-binding protein [Desulfatiglandales bacterium]|nr:ATP-binding protein [Desulfatiglandales bacterium]